MRYEPQPGFTRRQFLWLLCVGAGGAAVAKVAAPSLDAYPPPPPGLRVLQRRDWTVLLAVAEAFLPPATAADPTALDDVGHRVDAFLSAAPLSVRRQLYALLRAVEFGAAPLAGRLTRCSAMSLPERRRYLESWGSSRLAFRRAGFRALKRLTMLGYYTREAAWGPIGYRGPWV